MTAVREAASSAGSLELLAAWLRGALAQRLEQLRAAHGEARAELDALLMARSRVASGRPPVPDPLVDLGTRLDLREEEQRIVAVLVAAALEPALGRALGLLFDPLGRGEPTLEAIAELLGLPAGHRLVPDDGLVRWGLVASAGDRLGLDPMIEARLLGRNGRDTSLVEQVAIIPVRAPLPGWDVGAVADRVRRAIESGARSVRLWLRGAEGSGRRTLFAGVARELGLVGVAVASGAPPVMRAAIRLAWLDDLAPVWPARATVPADLAPPALQGLLDGEPPETPPIGVVDLAVRLPRPDREARRSTWQALVPAFPRWPEAEQTAVLDAWSARPGQLARVALAGADTAAAASAFLRAETSHAMEGLCEVLETPFGWDDLVLAEPLLTSLRELAHEAHALPVLWRDPAVGRLFPQGRSVTALLAGPPGTGKTMAAQVLAGALGVPLFRIDLSRIVSKYVGETSQNLARLLEAARDTDSVILFDEADALCGRRTEVHDAQDRYANTETNYLLQALETWPGLAILASNKRGNIDPAFLRRMRMVLEFNRPDARDRARLWARLAAALWPDRADDLSPVVRAAADTLELTGAQIKGAVLTARVLAARDSAPVRTGHLVRALERELEKDGRGLSARDRKRLVGE